jgi:hypothetical protein
MQPSEFPVEAHDALNPAELVGARKSKIGGGVVNLENSQQITSARVRKNYEDQIRALGGAPNDEQMRQMTGVSTEEEKAIDQAQAAYAAELATAEAAVVHEAEQLIAENPDGVVQAQAEVRRALEASNQ